MRGLTLLVSLTLLVLLAASQSPAPVRGQQVQPRPQSSLELGPAFDLQAQYDFEAGLDADERTRLVMLRSRFALAAADCPLPPAGEPFYVKFKADLTREFADTLAAAGASFIGYAWPHTHILRARDAKSAEALATLLRGHPRVAGTLLQRPEDRMSEGMFERLAAGGLAGDYDALFFRDTPASQAEGLLQEASAVVLHGRLEGANPRLTLRLTQDGVATMLASRWLEQLTPYSAPQTTNAVSTAMSNADPATIGVAPYGLDGNGQVAGVWDAGHARMTHEQYTGLAGVTAPAGWPGSSRVYAVAPGSLHDHAAHVTGTIVGNGTGNASAQGYAPKAVCLVHLWDNVDIGRRAAKHSYNHAADNHSYYNPGGWGGYNSITQEADITNRDLLACMVQSAGNSATSGSGKPFGGSNPTCSVPTSNAHRNGFIIGAVDDAEDRAGFSSCGPCGDGRLAPQFCANGVDLLSSLHNANDAYASYSGTSMSGPSTCGSVVLLSQLWQREHDGQNFTPDVARAVLAQTCRDKYHPGPDYQYGFGIVDCQAAADLVLADKAAGGNRIFRGSLSSGVNREYTFSVSTGDPIHIVLSWMDIWANTGSGVKVVNDLDIELVDPSANLHYPWRGVTTLTSTSYQAAFTNTGANNRDNLELVHVDNPAAGTWTLRVKGTSIPANPQTGVPNDETGFVIASSHGVALQQLRSDDPVNGSTPVSIPDNSATGILRSFVVNDARVVRAVRVHARVVHDRRGDLAITLNHPGGTSIALKTANNGMFDDETDIMAVFPDTKQDDDDMSALLHLPVQGTWTIRIADTANGNTGSLHYLRLELDVRVNNAPVADAGADVSVRETSASQLTGSASSDPDGDVFTYQWAQTGGSVTVNLSSATAANPTFTAPAVSADQVATFQLTCTDTSGATDTDTVQVTILNNQPPATNAGTDISLREQAAGQLDGSASSDPESDPFTYLWAQLSGPSITLSNTAAAQPTFTAPAVSIDQTAVFQLTCTDNRGDAATDTVQVVILNNLAPVAGAGADVALISGRNGALDATATSDPEGDPIDYAWAQVSGAVTLALSSSTAPQPTFSAPAVTQDEVVVFELTATDDRGDFSTDTVSITIELNIAPVADAGPNAAFVWNAAVTLDASASFDPNTGDSITYLWTQVGGVTTVVLSDNTSVQPTFTAPGVDDTLQFEVTVTDADGLMDTDIVTIWVNETGSPPSNSGGGGKKGGGGGCSTGTAQTWWWLALAAVLLTRIRRRSKHADLG